MLEFAWRAMIWLNGHSSPLVTGSVVIGVGVVCLTLAALMVLYALLWRGTLLVIDAAGIESFSDKGKGRLGWNDIAAVRVIEKVLNVSASAGKDISVPTGDINKTEEEIFAAISRYRPDVLPAESRSASK